MSELLRVCPLWASMNNRIGYLEVHNRGYEAYKNIPEITSHLLPSYVVTNFYQRVQSLHFQSAARGLCLRTEWQPTPVCTNMLSSAEPYTSVCMNVDTINWTRITHMNHLTFILSLKRKVDDLLNQYITPFRE